MMSAELLEARARLEAKIAMLIELIDLIDGDPDLEPYLADTGGLNGVPADDREDENEHGGDIQDEPHDELDEGNNEPSLGWSNPMGLRVHVPEEAAQMAADGWFPADMTSDTAPFDPSPCFDGDGHHQARKLLRDQVKDPRKRATALDRTRFSPGYGRFM